MDHQDHEHADPAIEAFLLRSRPSPRPEWVAETESALFASPHRGARLRGFRLTPVRFGAILAGGLAALLTALTLAGVGPLDHGTRDARAKDNCRTVLVTKNVKVPAIVDGQDGQPQVVYRTRRETRPQRVCR